MFTALITGLAGSLHCLGMCGPIAMALPGSQYKGFRFWMGRLSYNMGRITTYAILGALVSLFGVAAAMFDVQRWVSIGMGAVLLVMALRELGAWGQTSQVSTNAFQQWWLRKMGTMMAWGHGRGLFAIGMMNGLLPCGFVYLGLFQAAMSESVWEGSAKMALFGMGTWPVMLTLSVAPKWTGKWSGFRSKAVMPTVMLAMAVLFVVRGLALGIPYLSPKIELQAQGKVKMSCCEKIQGDVKRK